MSELRRQHQELLSAESGPSESMSIMYGTLLRKYEAVKDDFSLLSKRYDDLVTSHSAAVAKYEHAQVSGNIQSFFYKGHCYPCPIIWDSGVEPNVNMLLEIFGAR